MPNRYAMVMAGGSGTRLWPMSRASLPKQLIPFIKGRSLLQVAVDRLAGLVDPSRVLICAGAAHRSAILTALPGFPPANYLGEPTGRDTLNAVGYVAAVIHHRDPDAVIAVFTADHVIEPVGVFQQTVHRGFALAERQPDALVTFGVRPTHAATGYGYLELGGELGEAARRVSRFKEKPAAAAAQAYLDAGPARYLWNSGMFVWRAATLLRAIEAFAPAHHAGLMRIGADPAVIDEVYPTLKKISIDFAVMEPASTDPRFTVAALPMELSWLDVGSWPSYAQVCDRDEQGNAQAAQKLLLLDCADTLIASDAPDHLIAAIGCRDLVIIHTARATLVCPRDRAEEIKQLYAQVGERFGAAYL